MSTKLTVETYLAVVRKSGLVDRERLDDVLRDMGPAALQRAEPATIAERLIAAGLITPWQSEKLLQGKHRGYFLGKYKLLALLGKGGMSSVYLAEHLLMRRRCALKVLPAKRVDDSSYLERFHREAQAVALLDHPNIVRAYDVDHQPDGDRQIHFLVMEHVDGASLQDIVTDRGVLPFLDAAEYARQAAAGLENAHEHGMVHRDIKPGNLLVDQNGVVKILDLGLARFFRKDEGESALTLRHDERVLGTADYLAPEQALDSHTVDSRADIYSLGCTLYFMLTGRPPFTEGGLAQRLMAHQVKTPPTAESLRPEIPVGLAAILRKMMEKQPDDRYQTAADLEHALFQWVDDNADPEWRGTHSGVYGARTSSAVTVPKAIPVAPVVRTASRDVTSRDTFPQPEAISPEAKSVLADSEGTAAHETELHQFFSTLSQPDASLPLNAGPASQNSATESPFSTLSPSTPIEPVPDIAPPVETAEVLPAAFDFTAGAVEKPAAAGRQGARTSGTRRQAAGINRAGTRSRRFSPGALAIVATVLVFVILLLSQVWPRKHETLPMAGQSLPPFPRDKHEVTVGSYNSEFSSIREALAAVRNRYRPGIISPETFSIRVASGTYTEELSIDGRTKPWPEGVVLKGEGEVIIQVPTRKHLLIAGVARFSLVNVVIDAQDGDVALEVAEDLHETHISNCIFRGFQSTGILVHGAHGLAFGDNQLIFENLTFDSCGERAAGMRLDDSEDSDVNSLVIRGCRFLGPMEAGILFQGRAAYNIQISESIFSETSDGIRFEGQPALRAVQVTNNSFHKINYGINFLSQPSELSSELAFRRNLFLEVAGCEAIVQHNFDEARFRSMLSTRGPGVGQNWSDRTKPERPMGGELQLLFETGGRQGERAWAFASTDRHQPKFLAPTENSPQRSVEGAQAADKSWVGAKGP